MQMKTGVSRLLWYEGLGFLAIIVLSWINELTDLPRLAGSAQYVPNWREAALETLIVVLAAIPVMMVTRKLVSRLYYLEGFVRICAWCKKLSHDDEWIPLEQFLLLKFDTKASHGICPPCYEEAKSLMRPTATS